MKRLGLMEETIEKIIKNYVNLIDELEKFFYLLREIYKYTYNVILDLTNQLVFTQKELESL